MKLLEKNGERGRTDGMEIWGKEKTHCLKVMYRAENRMKKQSQGMSMQMPLPTLLERPLVLISGMNLDGLPGPLTRRWINGSDLDDITMALSKMDVD